MKLVYGALWYRHFTSVLITASLKLLSQHTDQETKILSNMQKVVEQRQNRNWFKPGVGWVETFFFILSSFFTIF